CSRVVARPLMLILCLILIIFLPPSLINCMEKTKKKAQSSRPKPLSGSKESNRDDSTLKDSLRKKNKKAIKVGSGAKTRSINQAMHDDRFPIASPSPLKQVYIKELP
ncbi:hypothetical protein PENTCL1PPCAC_11268, partial [Pristionchus entomophagus]